MMGGVLLHDTGGFGGASCKKNVPFEGERDTDDLCSCVHCPAVVQEVEALLGLFGE